MPRPTPAQFAYGSATVVLSTLAMLLLSGASTEPGLMVVTIAGLALGVLVALVLAGNRYPDGEPFEGEGAASSGRRPAPAQARSGTRGDTKRRQVEHSLHH